ncbi:glycine hydroxymethyltransferase [Streptomyces umbrinus]|uniref:Glycine hydroxymethyltransferase n=1 Tax=Streptomyces umbrinus TaxID=67370 RepID=A0ABU0T6Q2_9ACTN|nr:hypothetical protein [Streptomyces umbrinus]MDQ1031461.1 glycine hydroxymethyltransferase [Streptomyces umbrinus]
MPQSVRNGAALLAEGLSVLRAHQARASRTLSLIPAEGIMAPITRLPLISDLYARYMFDEDPDPQAGEWRFPSAKDAAWLETGLTVPLLARLTGTDHVNVRALSGLHAMEMVITALGGPPGSTIACLAPAQGGHYATADMARRLGHQVAFLPGRSMHELERGALAGFVSDHRPALVYLDQCHALHPLDVTPLVEAVREAGTNTLVHADISHTLGLVLGGALPNPLAAGADSLSASTHKSFPGPQKGIIATRHAATAQQIKEIQPQLVSNHHFAAVAALGLSLAAFADHAAAYAHTVVANAQTLGKELAHAGWDVVGAEFGYTRTHQLWITAPAQASAKDAAARLYEAGLHINWLTDLPLDEPALRLGLAEATWLGLNPGDMPRLARIMTAAVARSRPPSELADETAALRPSTLYPYVRPLGADMLQDASAVVHAVLGEVTR